MARLFTRSSKHFLTAGAAVVLNPPFSVAGWFRPRAEHTGFMFEVCDVVLASNHSIYLTDSASPDGTAVHAGSQGGGTSKSSKVGFTFAAGWRHAAGVWASTASRIAYHNGSAGTEETTDISVSIGNEETNLGRENVSSVDQTHWDGRLAWWAVWTVALTAAEVAVLAGTKAANGVGVVPWMVRPDALQNVWRLMRDGAASTDPALDLMGHTDLTAGGTTGTPGYADGPSMRSARRRMVA